LQKKPRKNCGVNDAKELHKKIIFFQNTNIKKLALYKTKSEKYTLLLFIHGIKIADFETKLSKGKNLNSSG
jgi:hypothetical protein